MDTQQLSIVDKIKRWRKIKEMTQDELSKKADIPYPTLVKIESGAVNNPSIETMMKIANGMQLTLDELIK